MQSEDGKKFLLETPSADKFMTVIEEAVNQVKEYGSPITIAVRITNGDVIDKPDNNGKTVDRALIGTHWKHYRNQKVYSIVGFAWHGDTDEWLVVYRRDGEMALFTRTLENFSSYVPVGDTNPVPRFTEVTMEEVRAVHSYGYQRKPKDKTKGDDDINDCVPSKYVTKLDEEKPKPYVEHL